MGVRQNIRSNFIRLFKPKASASSPTTSDIFLPTELWFNILSYLNEESIQSLSLTCSLLSQIAQPFLFQKNLVLYPFLTTIAQRRLDRSEYVARSLDRLDFFASPRIEPYIQELSLVPYPRGHALSRHVDPDVPENEIVDRLFDILPLLSHLTKLVLWSIKATPARITTLKNLSLHHFELETRGDDITWHSTSDTTFSIPVPSKKIFSLNCTVNPRHIHWFLIPLHFLYPDSLEEVYAGPDGTESILTAMSFSSHPFINLRVLDISLRFISSPHFLAALEHCPNLTSLNLRSSLTDNLPQQQPPTIPPVPSNVISLLTSYQGPPSLAESLSPGRSLRDVKLWSSRQPLWVWKPQKLLPFLSKLGGKVETLEIGVTTLPPVLLEALCNFMPSLRRLYVNAHLSTAHTGVPVTCITQIRQGTRFKPGLLGHARLRLDILVFGVQLSNSLIPPGSLEEETAALGALAEFPNSYDPTSWQQWSIESPWSKIIWERVGGDDGGRVSVERVEYKKPTFPKKD